MVNGKGSFILTSNVQWRSRVYQFSDYSYLYPIVTPITDEYDEFLYANRKGDTEVGRDVNLELAGDICIASAMAEDIDPRTGTLDEVEGDEMRAIGKGSIQEPPAWERSTENRTHDEENNSVAVCGEEGHFENQGGGLLGSKSRRRRLLRRNNTQGSSRYNIVECGGIEEATVSTAEHSFSGGDSSLVNNQGMPRKDHCINYTRWVPHFPRKLIPSKLLRGSF